MRTEFKKSFLKDLKRRKRDQIFLNSVKETIEKIEEADNIENIKNFKQLKGDATFCRIRFGDYRIGLKLENNIVIFVRVLHRKDIYRYFP